MQTKCIIKAVRGTREGTSQNGVQWKVNELLLAVPCQKKTGEPTYQEILADCFLDISDEKYKELVENSLIVNCDLWFSTHEFDSKLFQDCRVTNITLPLATE